MAQHGDRASQLRAMLEKNLALQGAVANRLDEIQRELNLAETSALFVSSITSKELGRRDTLVSQYPTRKSEVSSPWAPAGLVMVTPLSRQRHRNAQSTLSYVDLPPTEEEARLTSLRAVFPPLPAEAFGHTATLTANKSYASPAHQSDPVLQRGPRQSGKRPRGSSPEACAASSTACVAVTASCVSGAPMLRRPRAGRPCKKASTEAVAITSRDRLPVGIDEALVRAYRQHHALHGAVPSVTGRVPASLTREDLLSIRELRQLCAAVVARSRQCGVVCLEDYWSATPLELRSRAEVQLLHHEVAEAVLTRCGNAPRLVRWLSRPGIQMTREMLVATFTVRCACKCTDPDIMRGEVASSYKRVQRKQRRGISREDRLNDTVPLTEHERVVLSLVEKLGCAAHFNRFTARREVLALAFIGALPPEPK